MALMASSAGTFIIPSCATSTASLMLTPVTGWSPCTGIVEHYDGVLELVRWTEPGAGLPSETKVLADLVAREAA